MTEPMTVGSLFTGYGGLDMAVEEFFGAKTAWFSEVEPAAIKVFEHHNSGVPNLGDITKIDWTATPTVDIMCGGSPCQDMSTAGIRAGMLNGTRSGLWENMREGIATLRPKYVVWENVKGAFSAKAYSDVEQSEGRVGGIRALGRVVGDLANLGYDCRWGVVRASDAGAPHRRERVFLLAARMGSGASYPTGSRRGSGPLTSSVEASDAGPASNSTDSYARWGVYRVVMARWASRLASLAPDPIRGWSRNGYMRYNEDFAEWLMGLPHHYTKVADVTRRERMKMLGNGVVPQQAMLALELLTGEHLD